MTGMQLTCILPLVQVRRSTLGTTKRSKRKPLRQGIYSSRHTRIEADMLSNHTKPCCYSANDGGLGQAKLARGPTIRVLYLLTIPRQHIGRHVIFPRYVVHLEV